MQQILKLVKVQQLILEDFLMVPATIALEPQRLLIKLCKHYPIHT
jgi:hypothetical protein